MWFKGVFYGEWVIAETRGRESLRGLKAVEVILGVDAEGGTKKGADGKRRRDSLDTYENKKHLYLVIS